MNLGRPETLALLVLGPSHGTQVWLEGEPDVYLVAESRHLSMLLDVRHEGMSLATMPIHEYRRTSPCRRQQNEGAWIYEWWGKRA